MKDEHIIDLIESAPLARLDEAELARVRTHTSNCSECLGAFQAAQVSSLLLKERAAAAFEPTPFFHTRGSHRNSKCIQLSSINSS